MVNRLRGKLTILDGKQEFFWRCGVMTASNSCRCRWMAGRGKGRTTLLSPQFMIPLVYGFCLFTSLGVPVLAQTGQPQLNNTASSPMPNATSDVTQPSSTQFPSSSPPLGPSHSSQPSSNPTRSTAPSVSPSISPSSKPTLERNVAHEMGIMMTLRGVKKLNKTQQALWTNVTTAHVEKFYSDYLNSLGDRGVVPVEVGKVDTTFIKQALLDDVGVMQGLKIWYDQSMRYTVLNEYDNFDVIDLFTLPFDFDAQEYLIELMDAFDADQVISLVGSIQLKNSSRAPRPTPTGAPAPTNDDSGRFTKQAVSSLAVVGVVSVLLIGSALILNLHKREEQNRQNRLLGEQRQYQQQTQQEMEEQEQHTRRQLEESASTPIHPPPSHPFGTIGTTQSSLETVGDHTASLHSNTFTSSVLGGGDGLVPTSASPPHDTSPTPPPPNRPASKSSGDPVNAAGPLGVPSGFMPVSNVWRSRSTQSELTENDYSNMMEPPDTGRPSPVDRHHSSGVASDRMSEITASEYDPSLIATDDFDRPPSRLQNLPPDM